LILARLNRFYILFRVIIQRKFSVLWNKKDLIEVFTTCFKFTNSHIITHCVFLQKHSERERERERERECVFFLCKSSSHSRDIKSSFIWSDIVLIALNVSLRKVVIFLVWEKMLFFSLCWLLGWFLSKLFDVNGQTEFLEPDKNIAESFWISNFVDHWDDTFYLSNIFIMN